MNLDVNALKRVEGAGEAAFQICSEVQTLEQLAHLGADQLAQLAGVSQVEARRAICWAKRRVQGQNGLRAKRAAVH